MITSIELYNFVETKEGQRYSKEQKDLMRSVAGILGKKYNWIFKHNILFPDENKKGKDINRHGAIKAFAHN